MKRKTRMSTESTSLLVLLGLSLLFVALNQARAESRGLPHHDDFAFAEFPYARVLQGCTDWRRPDQMQSDDWGVVSFSGACSDHDKCYHDLDMSWSQCNRKFLDDLTLACDRDLKQALLAQGKVGDPNPETLYQCYTIAEMFHVKVQVPKVRKKYQFAQTQQKSYLEHVRSVVNAVFAEVRNRAPSDLESEEMIGKLRAGLNLLDIKESLAGTLNRLDHEQTSVRDQRAEIESEPPQAVLPASDEISTGLSIE